MNARHSGDATAEFPTLAGADGRPDADPADHDYPAEHDYPAWPLDGDEEPAVRGGQPDEEPVVRAGQPDEALVELDQDPFDDDLAQRLERRAPRLKATRLTLALAAGLLLVIGFVGGSLAQKQWGKTTTATNPFAGARTGATAFPGVGASGAAGGFGRGNGTGSSAGSTPITGTVKLIDGTTVYIVTPDGQTVIVKTGTGTTVAQPGSLSNLSAGSSVTVTGQTGSDGTVTATTITKTK